ncbi:MAG: hypothetical protein OXG46_05700 [Chloroflexi bacterium]|nr:hypothetical protein [Chloroflexota bacterium]
MANGDVFDRIRAHYEAIGEELASTARQASILNHPSNVGTEREEVYRAFLDRHVPKTCDVFLGGYVFSLDGNQSKQIDVIVTGGNAPRFRLSAGNHYVAPVEGTIAIAEIKSRLDKDSLQDALEKCDSIPRMPHSEGIVSPRLKVSKDKWQDVPYKVVFAYDGISADVILGHLTGFYNKNSQIPTGRRPNIIHVLGKYVVIRTTPGTTVINPDGEPHANQPQVGQYKAFDTSPDVLAMSWMLPDLQKEAFVSNHLFFKYDEMHNQIMDRIQSGLAG